METTPSPVPIPLVDAYLESVLRSIGEDPSQFELALLRIEKQSQVPVESMIAPFNAAL